MYTFISLSYVCLYIYIYILVDLRLPDNKQVTIAAASKPPAKVNHYYHCYYY